MNKQDDSPWKKFQQKWMSRRSLFRGAARTALGAGLIPAKLAFGRQEDSDSEHDPFAGPNPIPGGVKALIPYGVFVHHNPLNPMQPLAQISDPSQITDFDGFVGLTHIRGGGTGPLDPMTNMPMPLAFQADMGFSQGKFIGTDGRPHRGTFAFV